MKESLKSSKSIVYIFSAAAAVLVIILLLRSGVFSRDPRLETVPDNCYSDTLYVLTDRDYKPYSFFDESAGSFSGYDVELVTLVANRLGLNLDISFLGWSEAVASMGLGAADVLMTCDYSDDFDGLDRLYKSVPTSIDEFLVYSGHKVSSLSALVGKRIAIMESGNVIPLMAKLGLADYCVKYEGNMAAMQALARGEADFAVMRQSVGTSLLKDLGIRKVKGYLSAGHSYMCFGVDGSKPELAARIDSALEDLKKSGEFDRLGSKWLTTFVRPYTLLEVLGQNLWTVALFVMLVLYTLLSFSRTKQRELQEREDHLQKEMQYKEKLEVANKSKTDFLFNMSHDIRTPMNAIIGFTKLAKEHVDDKDRVMDSLCKIESSGNHLLDLINEVLDMSRVEAGKLRSEMKLVNVRDAAMRLVTICQENATERGLSLTFEDRGIIHESVMADDLHINQIVMNILGNAIKYTEPGGHVRFIVEEAGSDVAGYGRYVLTIQDDGVGMSKEFLGRIFDSFSREDNASTRTMQGTGLGMAIVKRLVDYMDGNIEVESEQGRGTKVTVTLHLKLVDGQDVPERQESVAEVDLSGHRVLLVEDNELNREIATFLLEEKGLIIECAANGIEAVEHVSTKGVDYYDCVLMDIQMPLMDGYKATEEIRKLSGSASLPIIALSANAFEEDRQRSLAAGMDGHVAKPIDIAELAGTMSRLIK